MFRLCKRFAIVGALVVTLIVPTGAVLAQGKGGGGGGKPPKEDPPAAPVNFQITWLGTLGGISGIVTDMNSSGTLVGSSRTGDVGTGQAIRIVPLVDGDGNLVYWQDANGDGINDLMENLNFVMNVPAGWKAFYAQGISDNGAIAGGMVNETTGINHGFLYDPIANPSFIDITPAWVPGDAAVQAGINNNGDLAGYYLDSNGDPRGFLYTAGQFFDIGAFEPHDISNSGQITGPTYTGEGGFRYTYPTDTLETFPSTRYGLAINDSGTFVGGTAGTSEKPYRYIAGQLEQLSDSSGTATGVNALNDVSGRVFGKGKKPSSAFLYTDTHGLLLLNDLVIGSQADVDQWLNLSQPAAPRMAQEPWLLSDGSVFSPMFGAADSQPFVLLPVPVASP